jgi:hypothetical protein
VATISGGALLRVVASPLRAGICAEMPPTTVSIAMVREDTRWNILETSNGFSPL